MCRLSPHHEFVEHAIAVAAKVSATEHPLVFRDAPNSRRLSTTS